MAEESDKQQLADVSVKVGMDEVVSVFISQWEDKLYTKKDELAKALKKAKKNGKDVVDAIVKVGTAHGKELEQTVPGLGIKITSGEVKVNHDDNTVSVTLTCLDTKADKNANYYYRPEWAIDRAVKIDKKLWKDLKGCQDVVNNLEEELQDIAREIASISRKERKVRGVISKQKLEECGYDELLANEQINNLMLLEEKS